MSAYKNELSQKEIDGVSMSDFKDMQSKKKATITGKINMDCTEAEFKQEVMNKTYDYDAFCKYMDESYHYKGCTAEKKLYYFLSKQTFGFGFEPFDLDPDLLDRIKKVGIKYVEE